MNEYSLNVNGRLMQLDEPKVMGILNLTPDSFYADSRADSEDEVARRVTRLLADGADIIDVGACSTRPGSEEVSVADEMNRLRSGLKTILEVAPDAILSVDTYRADVAAMCVEEFGVSIINDVSGGEADSRMFDVVARVNVPYVLTHSTRPPHGSNVSSGFSIEEMIRSLAGRVVLLHEKGVKDIIIDPGFGFGKSLEESYLLMNHLEELHLLNLPLLAGVSRKSMICRLLDIMPEDSLCATTALHALMLTKGVHLLRVHDVKECCQCIRIFQAFTQNVTQI